MVLCVTLLMDNIKTRPDINLVKNVPRFTHGAAKEMINLLTEAGMVTKR